MLLKLLFTGVEIVDNDMKNIFMFIIFSVLSHIKSETQSFSFSILCAFIILLY